MVAVCTGWVICGFAGQPLVHERFSTLDGLRGYLAYFVFLHHAFIWHDYVRLGKWVAPQSNLFNQFGQSSVALFFMITAFLFTSKVLDGRHRKIDWTRLYISRCLRLIPLYLLAMLLMFTLVGFATDWTLQVSIWDLVRSLFQWLIFTIKGNPDINGFENTFTVIAGVTWSLPYEWLFYFVLPILGLFIGLQVSNKVKFLSIAILGVMLVVFKPEISILSAFLGGMAAAVLARVGGVKAFAPSPLASLLILGALAYLLVALPGAYTVSSMLILSIVFILVASGNTLFGVLTSQLSRTLGEMGYGIYLLHGLLLFLVFHLLMGTEAAARLSEVEHWFVIGCLTPLLIVLAFLAYKQIERPSMDSTDRVLVWFRQRVR